MNALNTTEPAADPGLWCLDRTILFLNHGSFGSCPRHVLAFQEQLRAQLERQPVDFFVRQLEPLMDNARGELGGFLGASEQDIAFVQNATTGVNTVLRSLPFERDDELLVTNHEYNACRNALNYAAERCGARVVSVDIPFPLSSAGEIVERVLSGVTPRTRLALLDHVTSQTGLVFPIATLVRELRERGIETLVDGAHAPGMIPLDLDNIGAAYYTGNCHKWLCAPKGAAFLHVRRDRQAQIRPLTISHGANSPRQDRSRFLIEFGWTGTADPTAVLSVPEAIRFLRSLLPGGWPQIMQRNRALVLEARQILCRHLKIPAPCPDELIGSLASVPLPDGSNEPFDQAQGRPPPSPLYADPLQKTLLLKHSIEVPVIPWPSPPHRLLRISAQLYNALPQYESLAKSLVRELGGDSIRTKL